MSEFEVYRPSIAELKEMVTKVLGGKWFDDPSKEFDLNLGAIRNDEEEKAVTEGSNDETLILSDNLFNDLMYVAWMENGEMQLEMFSATTDPGYYWRQDPNRGPDGGVGAVREGYYPGVYRLGKHGKREALVQDGPAFQVYRDNDRNKLLTLDPGTTEKGWGFNLHYMGDGTINVNRWSGGCQGPNHKKDMDKIVSLVKAQGKAGHGLKVSYALMRSSWFGNDDLEWAKDDFALIQNLPLEDYDFAGSV